MSRTEHHRTLSELGFTVSDTDVQFVNEYQGRWALTGPTPLPNNYWVVTTDGRGHPIEGQGSPQQILDLGKDNGWDCAYAAPYGHYVEGADDGLQLHDWIRDRRKKQQKSLH